MDFVHPKNVLIQIILWRDNYFCGQGVHHYNKP